VVQYPALDVVVARVQGEVIAFNNACPHLKLPFFNREEGDGAAPPSVSKFTPDGQVECRWHVSTFDLHDGDISTWGQSLNPDGTAPGFEMLGDISKNRAPLELVSSMIEDGDIWLAIGEG